MPDKIPFYHTGYTPTPNATGFWTGKICKSPKSIYEHFNKYVYGHDEYKRVLSMLVWNAYNRKRPKGALLVVGDSGCGKTEMIRQLQFFYSNSVLLDCTLMTGQAYRGNSKTTSGLQRLNLGSSSPLGIAIFDEVDKLIQRADGGKNDSAPIWEMLKMLEGGEIDVSSSSNSEPCIIDTSNICFILMGSFEWLKQKNVSRPIGFARTDEAGSVPKLNRELVLEQLPSELRGRIETVCFLDSFTERDFVQIMNDEQRSPIKRVSEELGINLTVSPEKADEIARRAFKNHTGIRSISNELTNYCNNILFENPSIKDITME